MAYNRLLLMSFISFMMMYAIMFLNVDDGSHIYLSLTRTYMSLLMALPMVIIMIVFMNKMYTNRKKNIIMVACSVILFGVILMALRSQQLVGDIQYMKAMIPHHSSAILTSKHANIKDPEVKALSEQIIRSQQKEIEQMKSIIARMGH